MDILNKRDKEKILRKTKDLVQNSHKDFSLFAREIHSVSSRQGIQQAYNLLLQTEVILNYRKPSLAIFDHAFHFIGGAQKYGLTMIPVLQDQFDITIIANKDVTHSDFRNWYGLDLSKCKIRIIKVPFFENKRTPYIDPACISKETPNPFHILSKESGNYDVFVNNSMNEMVFPLSNLSVLICHFPERRPKSYFYADEYSYVVCNSEYTAGWIAQKWNLTPSLLLYPPVEMENASGDSSKKKYILSVARFEVEGTKRQLEMINAFIKLNQHYPEVTEKWKLIVVGGSDPDNPYLSNLQEIVRRSNLKNIELKVNLPIDELKALYQESSVFWHLCGLTQKDPSEIEHFGMTIVEAMQNNLVPLVYAGGGPKEIVDHGVNGFRVRSTAELIDYSIRLFKDPALIQKLGKEAHLKSQAFSKQKFEEKVRDFFQGMIEDYSRK